MEYTTLDKISENLDSMRKPITSSERVEGEIPYYGASGIVDSVKDYIFDEPLLLISEDGANLLARSTPIAFSIDGKTWVNNHAHVLRFRDRNLQKYVEMYLNHISLEPYITGSAQPKLNQKKLNEIPIPVADQNTIVQIVSTVKKVNSIINQRKQELQKLDELIKARFIELFGDPVADTLQWGQKPLKFSLTNIRYGTSSPPKFTENGYAFIRATNIKNGQIVKNDMKYIPQEEADRLEKCRLSGGEIIIVRSGVNAGDTCVVSEEYINQYAGYDIILVLNESMHPVFVNTLINTEYMDKIVKPLTRRAAQPHLNSEQVQSLPIIQVPYELQNQFADFVKQVDKSKVAVQAALDKAQLLFDSLMQEYFG